MAKKPKSLQSWLIPKLRNLARMWPEKNKARAKAARRVEIGKFKNGATQYKTMFECAFCGELFEKESTQMDHVAAVVDPATGFIDWNTYIERLFCGMDNYACLCIEHHSEKSKIENEKRRKVKIKKNNIKKT